MNTMPLDMSVDLLVPYFNKNDISWLIGFDYRLNQHWGLTGRYTRGITPLLSPEKHNLNTPTCFLIFLPSGLNIISNENLFPPFYNSHAVCSFVCL
jgi:hypothetical protein